MKVVFPFVTLVTQKFKLDLGLERDVGGAVKYMTVAKGIQWKNFTSARSPLLAFCWWP